VKLLICKVCLMMMNPDGHKRVTCLSECINNLFESICRQTNLLRSSNWRQICNLHKNVRDVFLFFFRALNKGKNIIHVLRITCIFQ